MLDDLKYIHERDAQDALGTVGKQWQQLLVEPEVAGEITDSTIQNVVYVGMGGSALAADYVSTWPGLSVPYEVVRNYDVPAYVNDKTLVIVASYSGNTEEAIHALFQARKANAAVAVIAGGGKLAEVAAAGNHLRCVLPKAVQPRYVVFSNYLILLAILKKYSLIGDDVMGTLSHAAEFIKAQVENWQPTVPTAQNQAKQLALEAIGKSVVVYAGPKMRPAAYKWKISFNENAKQVAWTGIYPEFNHNEYIGWSSHPVDKPYIVFDLRSNLEHPRVQQRFEVSDKLLSGKRPAAEVVEAVGETVLEQLLWLLVLGDFVSIYTGLANGVNPAEVGLIEKLKIELDQDAYTNGLIEQ